MSGALFDRLMEIHSNPSILYCGSNFQIIQGGPERTQYLQCMINNFKKTRRKMKKLCALIRIEFFSQQNYTKIIKFDEGVLILWLFFWGNVIFKFCHFCLKSHNWRTKNLHCLAPLVKVSALALKNEDSMNKEKHSLHNFPVLQSSGSYSKKFLPTSIMTFDRKEANFENEIAWEKWL